MQSALRALFRTLSMVAPGLAARLAERLWFRVPKPKINDASLAFLASGNRFSVSVNGRTVSAWRWGSGPAVVLMHGWGGYGAQFQGVIEELQRRGLQAVTFDALSHGESAPGALGAHYATLFEFGDALSEVMRTTPNVVGVVAHSGGAAATAWAMGKHPEWPLQRIVFIAPFASIGRYIDLFQRTLGLSDEVIRRFRSGTEARYGFRWPDLEVPAMAKRMRTPPVLVIHDREDRETAWQDGADLAAGWPESELVTTTGLGHNRILRDPQIVKRIVDFVSPPAGRPIPSAASR